MSMFEFNMPFSITCGPGALKELATIVCKYGSRVVVVVDIDELGDTAIVDEITDILAAKFINHMVFSEINKDSTSEACDALAHVVKFSQSDVIIAFGGFHVQNIAKGAAAVLQNSGEACDYINGQKCYYDIFPIISIPIAVGNFLELSSGLYIRDKYDGIVKSTIDKKIHIRECIIDPEIYINIRNKYLLDSVFSIFASSFDAYMHADATSVSDLFAKKGMNIAIKNVASIVNNAKNLDVMNEIAFASMYTSCATSMVGVGTLQSISIGLNARVNCGMPTAMIIILPYLMDYHLVSMPDKYKIIAKMLDDNLDPDMNSFELATKAIVDIRKMIENFNLSSGLNEINIYREEINDIASYIHQHIGIQQSTREVTADNLQTILLQAY